MLPLCTAAMIPSGLLSAKLAHGNNALVIQAGDGHWTLSADRARLINSRTLRIFKKKQRMLGRKLDTNDNQYMYIYIYIYKY